jgi:hypothetical protein
MKKTPNKAKLLLEFADKIYNDMSVIRYYRGEIPIVNSVSFYHITRARSLLKSIYILYRKKQFPDVSILLRTLIEVFIRLSWILLSDAEGKCRRYADMAIVLRTRSAFKSKADISEFLMNEGERYKKRYEEACTIAKQYGYKSIFDVRKWSTKILLKWRGKQVQYMSMIHYMIITLKEVMLALELMLIILQLEIQGLCRVRQGMSIY